MTRALAHAVRCLLATKNLARTVIEGGRHRNNKRDRWYSNRAHRRSVDQHIKTNVRREDGFEDRVVPVRDHVDKDFEDKLGPVRRWMNHQVGRAWDVVRAEIFVRFDTRTMAGYHIVYAHMLEEVRTGVEATRWWRRPYYVDARGLLQRSAVPRVPRDACGTWRSAHGRRRAEVMAWVGTRKVGRRGSAYYWFVPVTPTQEVARHRQDRRLTADEVGYYIGLCDCLRRPVEMALAI